MLWAVVATSIESVPESSNELLSDMATLITASLRSRHKTILNHAVQMWNRKFGCSERLDYTDDLRSALLDLKLLTEVDTPGLIDEQSQQVSVSSKRDGKISNHSNPHRTRFHLFVSMMKSKQTKMSLQSPTSNSKSQNWLLSPNPQGPGSSNRLSVLLQQSRVLPDLNEGA